MAAKDKRQQKEQRNQVSPSDFRSL